MEKFVKGDIVVIPFPFSDLSRTKRRPACVVAVLRGDDMILCQITSKDVKDDYAIKLMDADFVHGSLNVDSHIRPNRIFTADRRLILYKIGRLKKDKMVELVDAVVNIVNS